MPFLTIDGKEFHPKTNFAFERVANDKYSEGDVDGFMSIYLGLLQYENMAISHFWDCALHHYKKDKPTSEQIEEALEARIEEDGDTDKLLKEAFKVLDDAGFFKKRVKSIWKELTNVPSPEEDETEEEAKERKQQEQFIQVMEKRRKDLTTKKS